MTGDETSARAGLAGVLAGVLSEWESNVGDIRVDSDERSDLVVDFGIAVLAYLGERLGSAGMREAVAVELAMGEPPSEADRLDADGALAAVAAGLGVALGEAGDVRGAPVVDSEDHRGLDGLTPRQRQQALDLFRERTAKSSSLMAMLLRSDERVVGDVVGEWEVRG